MVPSIDVPIIADAPAVVIPVICLSSDAGVFNRRTFLTLGSETRLLPTYLNLRICLRFLAILFYHLFRFRVGVGGVATSHGEGRFCARQSPWFQALPIYLLT